MSFIPAARKHLSLLGHGSDDYKILKFLINNAIGKINAKSWKAIKTASGLTSTSKEQFQQGLLKFSREKDFFIGSCSRGYYMIDDRADAIATKKFYQDRIDIERLRVINLECVASSIGWGSI